MATFHFDLVSPEKLLISAEVEHVVVPGSEGEFGVLASHAPLVSMLKPGILTVLEPAPAQRIVVGGGFAEVNSDGLTVLAEIAVPVDEFDITLLDARIKDIEEDVADAKDDASRDKLRQRLDHLQALRAALD
jgi:F-type H+-transporting ATPase subunit epsilon